MLVDCLTNLFCVCDIQLLILHYVFQCFVLMKVETKLIN